MNQADSQQSRGEIQQLANSHFQSITVSVKNVKMMDSSEQSNHMSVRGSQPALPPSPACVWEEAGDSHRWQSCLGSKQQTKGMCPASAAVSEPSCCWARGMPGKQDCFCLVPSQGLPVPPGETAPSAHSSAAEGGEVGTRHWGEWREAANTTAQLLHLLPPQQNAPGAFAGNLVTSKHSRLECLFDCSWIA